MKEKVNLLLLPGDGIGPEVCIPVKKIINCLNNFTNIEFSIEEDLVGGCSYDEFKLPITEKVISFVPSITAFIFDCPSSIFL